MFWGFFEDRSENARMCRLVAHCCMVVLEYEGKIAAYQAKDFKDRADKLELDNPLRDTLMKFHYEMDSISFRMNCGAKRIKEDL